MCKVCFMDDYVVESVRSLPAILAMRMGGDVGDDDMMMTMMMTINTVCLFVRLHARSMRRHTCVLMGPDSDKMLKVCRL